MEDELNRLRKVCIVALGFVAAFAALAAMAADRRDAGPLGLIITYHTTPANRAAFREQLEHAGGRQFQRWKDEGVLQSYHMLFNRYVDSHNWDAMVVLGFASPADLARWKKVERQSPAGLFPEALALTDAIETVPADAMREGSSAEASRDPVYLVIPYEVLVPTAEYLSYLDGYVIPQLEGWKNEGVLSAYRVYLPRYGAGRPWASLLMLEYRNEQALGAREAVVAKVRERLKENREWKAISDNKKKMREEKQLVIADPIALR